jgi:hypothetical protein
MAIRIDPFGKKHYSRSGLPFLTELNCGVHVDRFCIRATNCAALPIRSAPVALSGHPECAGDSLNAGWFWLANSRNKSS